MDQDEIKLQDKAYERAVALFEELAPEIPPGISPEIFLDLGMQAALCRFSALPMSPKEQDNKIRAIIGAIADYAPPSVLEAKVFVQMLNGHEVITASQFRLMNQPMPSERLDALMKNSLKAQEVYVEQLDALDKQSTRREVRMKVANAYPEGARTRESIEGRKGPLPLPESSGAHDALREGESVPERAPAAKQGGG